MNKIYLLFILISISTFGQIENFVIENSQVRWQKIYSTSKTQEEIVILLKKKNNLFVIEIKNNNIEGQISNLVMDRKKSGYSKLGVPDALDDDVRFSGFFTIEFKDGRYRATARNITSQGGDYSLLIGNIPVHGNQNTSLENITLNRKGEIKDNFKKAKAKIIDMTFTDLFDFTQAIEEKVDNW
jgi:hypothetical protein